MSHFKDTNVSFYKMYRNVTSVGLIASKSILDTWFKFRMAIVWNLWKLQNTKKQKL